MVRMHMPLLLKRRVHQQIDGRYHRLVTRDEALAEIAQKIVVTRLRLCDYEVTARLGEFVFHLETRKCSEDFGHFCWRDQVEAEPAIVEPYAHGAQSHFRLLVERDRWCRVEGDKVPDELRAAGRYASFLDKRHCGRSAVDFEAV